MARPTKAKTPGRTPGGTTVITRGRADAEFSEADIRHVANEVLLLCSKPDCRRPCFGPTTDPERLTNVGTAAHIAAASNKGPRARPDLLPEQRRSPKNAIWLCRDHGKLVDDDENAFRIEDLEGWKRDAIDYAHRCVVARTLDVDGRQNLIFATRHDLVKQLWPAIATLDTTRGSVSRHLAQWKFSVLGDSEAARSRLSASGLKTLTKAIEAVVALEHQVQGVFGDEVHALIMEVCTRSRQLSRWVRARLDKNTMAGIAAAPLPNEPFYGGAAFERRLSGLTELIRSWSAAYFGRDGAVHVPLSELLARQQEISRRATEEATQEWSDAENEHAESMADTEADYWRERIAEEQRLAEPIELGAAGRATRTSE